MTRRANVEKELSVTIEPEVTPTEEVVADAQETKKSDESDEFLPVDVGGNWCPNCNSRLRFDYINNHPVCPLADNRCPQHTFGEVD